ncbi:MAG: IgGFc-binding protein [Bacteroidales bacterium]|nr:IgGFc-binding protein [Bacteroidales bacterium]
MKHILLFILSFICIVTGSLAQNYTEFWFTVPYIDKSHDSDGDNTKSLGPNYFKITTGVSAASVSFYYFPAGVQTLLFTKAVAANSTGTVTLAKAPLAFDINLATLEADQYSTILERGLYIESDLPVNIYYQIGSYNNTEIFSLKGVDALGTTFYPLMQTVFPNGGCLPWGADSWTTVDIVATEDNTVVNIDMPSSYTGGVNNIYTYKTISTIYGSHNFLKPEGGNPTNFFAQGTGSPNLYSQTVKEVWLNGVLQTSTPSAKVWLIDTTSASFCHYCVGMTARDGGWNGGTIIPTTYFQQQFKNPPFTGAYSIATISTSTVTDSTVYTITPIVFAGYSSTSITLNKGEIYSVKAATQTAIKLLTGIKVSSDKNIAVSVKDDTALDGTCGVVSGDLIGDQNIPTNKAGKKYIVPDFNVVM